MSDNKDAIKTSPRREKPQTLEGIQATKSLNEPCGSDASHTNCGSDKQLPRNRSHCSEIDSQRDQSTDGVLINSCNDFNINDGHEDGQQRRESFNYTESSSPSSHGSFIKSALAKSVRLPNVASGTATRKCVLTLDGYSYVIVASTPENLPKKEDLSFTPNSNNPNTVGQTQTGSGSSSSASGYSNPSQQQFSLTSDKAFTNKQTAGGSVGSSGGGIDTATGTAQSEQFSLSGTTSSITAANTPGGNGADVKQDISKITSPSGAGNSQEYIISNASITSNSSASSTLNGQVARHGSLTIVRRSNSRKSISQHDSQYLYSSLASTPTPSSAATTTNQFLLGNSTTTKSLTANDIRLNDTKQSAATGLPPSLTHTTASSNNTTNNTNTTTKAQTIKMLPTSPSATTYTVEPSGCADNTREDSASSAASGSTSNASVIDLATDNLPAVDTPDACDKAALRLRSILRMLNTGEIQADILQKNLHYAARVLEAVFLDESKRLADEDDELSEVQPDAVPPEVREWLASTFTRQMATTRRKTDEKPKFRSVAHAIRAGIFVDRIYRKVSSTALLQFPSEVAKVLKNLDDWSFDVFALAEAANGQPVKYIGYDLLNRYGLIHKFKIAPATLETFLNRIEEGYCRYRNPYHNNLHAADVTQTVHHMLCQTGLMNWMTDLEIYATLFAALIHDYEHTGTTNNFHVMSGSETALLYNDRAVLENHHISAAFRLLKDDDCNVMSNLSREEYREMRTLIIDMVLSTDMSFHFQQLKNMKSLLTLNEGVDKSKVLSMVLHCCDISHPSKRWNLHHRWTMLLLEEFFRQGDLERELGLPFSPLCDRNSTLVAESQIGFIDFIVDPSMAAMGDMLEQVLAPIAPMCKNVNASIDAGDVPIDGPPQKPSLRTRSQTTCEAIEETTETKKTDVQTTTTQSVAQNSDGNEASSSKSSAAAAAFRHNFSIRKPWMTCLSENRKIWKERAIKERAQANAAKQVENALESENDN